LLRDQVAQALVEHLASLPPRQQRIGQIGVPLEKDAQGFLATHFLLGHRWSSASLNQQARARLLLDEGSPAWYSSRFQGRRISAAPNLGRLVCEGYPGPFAGEREAGGPGSGPPTTTRGGECPRRCFIPCLALVSPGCSKQMICQE